MAEVTTNDAPLGHSDNGPLAHSDDERRWIVLLEAIRKADGSPVTTNTAYGLSKAMGGDAVGLHSPDRVAVQVPVWAVDVAVALVTVVSRWRSAEARLALQGWDVVRAEVLTLEEFERDCEVG